MIERLRRDRTLRFHLDGQTILADDYLDVRPEQRDRLRRLVEAGRITLGPWYVLADELLAGDETLVRNLLVGRRRAAALGGWLPVGYSPDAFGHPAGLPTLLRGFGIEVAVLWRGHGRDRTDPDLFRWVGPDGSNVLVHHLPPSGYEYGAELPANRDVMRERWRAIGSVLEPRAVVPVLLVMNGADHHALQPDLQVALRALRAMVPDTVVEVGTLDDYFTAVRGALAGSDAARLRRVTGELRWSYGYTWTLQGVAATRTALKRRIAEGTALLVRWAEPQTALAAAGTVPHALLDHVWRTHLANLSHDILAGSVADEVADDVAVRARQVVEDARGLLCDGLDARLGQDPVRRRRELDARKPALVIVNPSPRSRTGVLEATVTFGVSRVVVGKPGGDVKRRPLPPFHLTWAGTPVPMQVLQVREACERLDSPRDYPEQDRVWAVRVAVRAPDVPPFGLARLDLGEGAVSAGSPPAAVMVRGRVLQAAWGDVRPHARGFAVRTKRPARDLAPLLTSARDRGDTYTIQPVRGDRPVRARWGVARAIWRGPLTAAVARPFAIGSRVRGTLYARVDAGSPLVRLSIEGENRAGNHRVRLHLPVGTAGAACADMMFGAETRTRVQVDASGFPSEHPVATAPMHRWVSAGGWTIFARGLHEYEILPDGAVAVTLLRAVGELSRGDLPARPGHAAWPAATPGAQGLGSFRAELALAPLAVEQRSPGAVWDAIEALSDEFHAPLAGAMYRAGMAIPMTVSGPRLDGQGLSFRALKPRDEGEGTVARCVNLTRRQRQGTWTWPIPITRAYRARLDETVEAELPLSPDRRSVAFTAEAREVVTVVVEV